MKGAELIMHQNSLLVACIYEVEEQIAVIIKRKSRKRKQIQHDSTIEYRNAAAQVALEASAAPQQSKKARSSGSKELAQRAVRRFRNCSRTGHNARTCKIDTEISSDLAASMSYASSLLKSDEIEDS